MATHELYIGGPPTRNYSQAMFPAVPFNADAAAFQVGPAAHKGPIGYADTRLLDFGSDHALAEFMRENTVAQGDDLGVVLIPKDVLFLGFHYSILNPVEGLTLTPMLRDKSVTFTAIDMNPQPVEADPDAVPPVLAQDAVFSAFVAPGGGAGVTSGVVNLGAAFYDVKPYMLDLRVTAVGDAGLGALKLVVSPILLATNTGGYR